MPCNFCGSYFHYDQICNMNPLPEYPETKIVPVWFRMEMREKEKQLDLDIFDRWIESL